MSDMELQKIRKDVLIEVLRELPKYTFAYAKNGRGKTLTRLVELDKVERIVKAAKEI